MDNIPQAVHGQTILELVRALGEKIFSGARPRTEVESRAIENFFAKKSKVLSWKLMTERKG